MECLLIGSVYSGKEFNLYVKETNKKLVRLTNESENHNGFQYKTGLNIDTLPFNPLGSCKPGGLYFCDISNFTNFINYKDKKCVNIRNVIIPDDSIIYVENKKYKTDKFILDKPEKIFENIELCLVAVKQNGYILKYVKEQTSEICLEAVKQSGGTSPRTSDSGGWSSSTGPRPPPPWRSSAAGPKRRSTRSARGWIGSIEHQAAVLSTESEDTPNEALIEQLRENSNARSARTSRSRRPFGSSSTRPSPTRTTNSPPGSATRSGPRLAVESEKVVGGQWTVVSNSIRIYSY